MRAAPLGDNSSQRGVIVAAVCTEADELWSWPFIGAIGELPSCPVSGAVPVDDPALSGAIEEDGKGASLGIDLLAELPGELEQVGEEVVSFVACESVGITATTDRPDEQSLRIGDVVQ